MTKLKSMGLHNHMDMLRKTPFRHLFKAIAEESFNESICKRSNSVIRKIITCYESKTTHLKIGVNKKIQITEEMIRLTFGIVDGDQIIQARNRDQVHGSFIDRLYSSSISKQNEKLTKKKKLKKS